MNNSLQRIIVMIVRCFIFERRTFFRIADFFYYPTLDIVVWGFASAWIAQTNPHATTAIPSITTAIALWLICTRANYEVSVNLIDEIWNRSLVTMFSTPLSFGEWVIAILTTSVIKIIFLQFFCSTLIYLFYGYNIFSIGGIFFVFALLLTIFGWILGLVGAGIIINWGHNVSPIPWMIPYLFVPISAVYYPLSTLPTWLKTGAYFFPAAYLFESLRTFIETGIVDYQALAVSTALNFLYFVAALLFFKAMFRKSLTKGFGRFD